MAVQKEQGIGNSTVVVQKKTRKRDQKLDAKNANKSMILSPQPKTVKVKKRIKSVYKGKPVSKKYEIPEHCLEPECPTFSYKVHQRIRDHKSSVHSNLTVAIRSEKCPGRPGCKHCEGKYRQIQSYFLSRFSRPSNLTKYKLIIHLL